MNENEEINFYKVAFEAATRVVTRQHQAVLCLRDAEGALRLGRPDKAVEALFIWSQRSDRILAGEETWADQNFSLDIIDTQG